MISRLLYCGICALLFPSVASKHALAPLLVISVLTGLALIVAFGYLSDQRAVRRARDQLRAQLLAVRLFQEQPQVVLQAYGRIVTGTGRYLRASFVPLAIVIVPLLALLVQLDRYFGSIPFQAGQPILLTVRVDKPDLLEKVDLRLPGELSQTAPAVHIAANNEVNWRLAAAADGHYKVSVLAGTQEVSKQVVVSNKIERLSECRMRGHFLRRVLNCAESALPAHGPVRVVAVNYAAREIGVGPWETNWLVVYFVVSLAAALVFKFVLGIEI